MVESHIYGAAPPKGAAPKAAAPAWKAAFTSPLTKPGVKLRKYRVTNVENVLEPVEGLANDPSEAIRLVVEHQGGQSQGLAFKVEEIQD